MADDKPSWVGELREPAIEHLEHMAAIFVHGQEPHHDKFPDLFCKADDHAGIVQYLRGFLKPRNPFRTRQNFATGWFVDNALRGYLLYHLYETSNVFFGKKRWVCFVEDIAIDPDCRSLGGASMLINHLTDKIDLLDNCIASATVWRGNDASEALFRKYGYEDLSKTFYRVIK